MSLVRYKDYLGSVDFIDGKLVIKVLYIDDIITTECDSAAQAQGSFEELVEDYIETCRSVNKEPSRPFKGSFNVRVSPALHRSVAMCAMESGDSMNAWIEKVLAERVESQKTTRRFTSAAFIERFFGHLGGAGWSQTIVSDVAVTANSPVISTKAYSRTH